MMHRNHTYRLRADGGVHARVLGSGKPLLRPEGARKSFIDRNMGIKRLPWEIPLVGQLHKKRNSPGANGEPPKAREIAEG